MWFRQECAVLRVRLHVVDGVVETSKDEIEVSHHDILHGLIVYDVCAGEGKKAKKELYAKTLSSASSAACPDGVTHLCLRADAFDSITAEFISDFLRACPCVKEVTLSVIHRAASKHPALDRVAEALNNHAKLCALSLDDNSTRLLLPHLSTRAEALRVSLGHGVVAEAPGLYSGVRANKSVRTLYFDDCNKYRVSYRDGVVGEIGRLLRDTPSIVSLCLGPVSMDKETLSSVLTNLGLRRFWMYASQINYKALGVLPALIDAIPLEELYVDITASDDCTDEILSVIDAVAKSDTLRELHIRSSKCFPECVYPALRSAATHNKRLEVLDMQTEDGGASATYGIKIDLDAAVRAAIGNAVRLESCAKRRATESTHDADTNAPALTPAVRLAAAAHPLASTPVDELVYSVQITNAAACYLSGTVDVATDNLHRFLEAQYITMKCGVSAIRDWLTTAAPAKHNDLTLRAIDTMFGVMAITADDIHERSDGLKLVLELVRKLLENVAEAADDLCAATPSTGRA